MKTMLRTLCLWMALLAICSACSETEPICAEPSVAISVKPAETAAVHIAQEAVSTEAESEPESESDAVTLREQYPYVDTYAMAYDAELSLRDCVDGASLIRFTVEERLEDVVVETDMMAGTGMSDEELSFFEQAGMRYVTTTYEQYAVRRTDTVAVSGEDDSVTILHNTTFGEMDALLEPGREFAAFLKEDQTGLICSFETLYYLTDTETLLSVVDNPMSRELDGLTWEQAVAVYAGEQ